MNRIDDEPIRFYLEHQDRIREWAALEADVREFADRFYRSLKTDLETAVRSGRAEDGDVEVLFHEEGHHAGITLRRQIWPRADEKPDVRLEWNGRRIRFAPDELYVGVRAKGYKDVFTREACPNYRGKPSSHWPLWETIEGPSGRFWESHGLQEYRHRIVREVLSAWDDLAPLVDKAVASDATRPTKRESDEF